MSLTAQIRELSGYIRRVYGPQKPAAGWYDRGGVIIHPAGWQGAAQHTWTRSCDGIHGPGPCLGDLREETP